MIQQISGNGQLSKSSDDPRRPIPPPFILSSDLYTAKLSTPDDTEQIDALGSGQRHAFRVGLAVERIYHTGG